MEILTSPQTIWRMSKSNYFERKSTFDSWRWWFYLLFIYFLLKKIFDSYFLGDGFMHKSGFDACLDSASAITEILETKLWWKVTISGSSVFCCLLCVMKYMSISILTRNMSLPTKSLSKILSKYFVKLSFVKNVNFKTSLTW